MLLILVGCQSQQQPQQQSSKNADSSGASDKNIADVVSSIRTLERQGRGMEELRLKTDSGGAAECAELMRKNGKTVAELQNKIKSFPRLQRTYLVPALTEVEVCASCSTGSLEACDNVNKSLEDMQKALETKE